MLTFSVIIFLVGEIIQTLIGRILLASQEEKNDDDAIHIYNKAQPPKKFMDHKSFSKTKGLTALFSPSCHIVQYQINYLRVA